MHQWLTIAKVGGASADLVEGRFHRWQAQRIIAPGGEKSWEPSQWPAACHAEMEALVAGLHANAEHPPVLFYCRYMDLWSMFDDLRLDFLRADDKAVVYEALCPGHELYALRVLDRQHVLDLLKQERRRRSMTQERRSYVGALADAVDAWGNLTGSALIVCVRTVIGGLVEDDEVKLSLDSAAAWLKP